MREVRSRMKEELDYQMNEKAGKYYSIKKNKREWGDGRIFGVNGSLYRYPICRLPFASARQSNEKQ